MRECLHCGAAYEPRSTVQKYCSIRCRDAVNYAKRSARLQAAREGAPREQAPIKTTEAVNDHRENRKQRMQEQIAWLDRQSRKPRGYPQMTIATHQTTLGQLWVSLCHADGQVNCLTRSTGIDARDRERLLILYFRLRLKGFASDAIAKVCPVALLEQGPDAFDHLPDVEAQPDHPEDDDPIAGMFDAQRSDAKRSDAQAHSDQQERHRLQTLLGL